MFTNSGLLHEFVKLLLFFRLKLADETVAD